MLLDVMLCVAFETQIAAVVDFVGVEEAVSVVVGLCAFSRC